MSDHGGAVVWVFGLSGAGKTTLSNGLHARCRALGLTSVVLDGDRFRRGVSADLGFSDRDRSENLRRAAEIAAWLATTGIVVIASFISPREADRQTIRQIVQRAPAVPFASVFLSASLSVCEARDVKQLYARARAGQIEYFTGVSAPFEAPADPDLTLDTGVLRYEEALSALEQKLLKMLSAG